MKKAKPPNCSVMLSALHIPLPAPSGKCNNATVRENCQVLADQLRLGGRRLLKPSNDVGSHAGDPLTCTAKMSNILQEAAIVASFASGKLPQVQSAGGSGFGGPAGGSSDLSGYLG